VSTRRRPRTGKADDEGPLDELYGRPGFMLRRAHQIAVATFLEEAAAWGVTTSQFGALFVLSRIEGLDIVSLGRRLGMDRSTSALVVSRLEAAGWVLAEINEMDRRRKTLALTDAGRAVLAELSAPAQAARDRLLSVFAPGEADDFLRLLDKFVGAFNGVIRTPIIP
jgi:DNA-binding MarR family transcriptional regulator